MFNKAYNQQIQSGVIQYSHYFMTIKEKTAVAAAFGFLMAGIGFIFYKNIYISIILAFSGIWFIQRRKMQLINKRKEILSLQFAEALYCLSSALAGGKSIESAFRESLQDLKMLYPDPACLIVLELELIQRRLENGDTIEKAMIDLANRSGLEDICNFADVFITCKRTGGNLIEVIRRTSAMISEKLEIQQHIAVSISQKKFESKVLTVAPIFIVAALSLTSPDYMDPLYNGLGRMIMTICLVVLTICFVFTQKMMNIKV